MLKLGVIGYGYWGPNIVRNFSIQPDCEVVAVCDKNPKAVAQVLSAIPAVHVTTNPEDVLRSPDIDAVAVVTPVWTHYELAKAALENGKHVFVEKPFTSTLGAGRRTDRAGRPEESARSWWITRSCSPAR